MKWVVSILLMAVVSFCLLALVAIPLKGDGDNTDKIPETPLIHNVTPDITKTMKTVTVTGMYLGKSHVIELYLTRGGVDFKLAMKTQKPDQILAVIPAEVTGGKYRLMVQTAGELPRFIEQPVYLTIE